MAANAFDAWSLGTPIGALGSDTGSFAAWSLGSPVGGLLPAGGVTYAETGSGGVKPGCTSPASVACVVAGSGGAKAGGASGASATFAVTAAAGATLGGSAAVASNGLAAETGAAGLKAGCTSYVSARSAVVGAFGVKLGCTSTVAVVAIDPGPATLRDAVRRLLRDSAPVVALVGQKVRYARSGQKDAEPRITYIIPSRTFGRDLDGPDGTSDARVRVSVWSTDSEQAADLADRVRMALDGYSGWVGTVYIASIDHLVSNDLPEWDGDGGESSVYQVAIDFNVDHRVEIPARA